MTGRINPSGKLAVSLPVSYEDVPSAKNFPGNPSAKPEHVIYQEGVYVGYRYYNSFNIKTSFPFGFGLSYTTFSYSELKLSAFKFNKSIRATVKVTNSGAVAGKEIVQLYLHAPCNLMDKPIKELKGFAKTALLKPGESETVSFNISENDLASFYTLQSAWMAEKGKYVVEIASSSERFGLKVSFRLADNITVERVSKALCPAIKFAEFKP